MFPIPDFGAGMGAIIDEAMTIIGLINQQNFFQVLAAFWLIIMVLRFVIRLLREPPKLDI